MDRRDDMDRRGNMDMQEDMNIAAGRYGKWDYFDRRENLDVGSLLAGIHLRQAGDKQGRRGHIYARREKMGRRGAPIGVGDTEGAGDEGESRSEQKDPLRDE